MKIIVVLSAFFLFYLTFAKEPILFDVHMESKCRFSQDFVLRVMAPENYTKIKDDITLRFFLCGKSSHSTGPDGREIFECQHGEPECEDNKKITCGNYLLNNDQDKMMTFVRCSMKMQETVEECAAAIGIDLEKLQECFEGDLGYNLMIETCDKSKGIIMAKNGTHQVPDIVLNDAYVEQENAQCRVDIQMCVGNKLAELAAPVEPVEGQE